METYDFKPREYPIISGFEAINMINYIRRGVFREINLTLGKHDPIPIKIKEENIVFEWNYKGIGKRELRLNIGELEELARKEYRLYAIYPDNSIEHLGFFRDSNYYQLIAIDACEAPTIEINGIRMHRTKEITPYKDAKSKVVKLKIKPKMNVLDICTGLGYTAIWALKFGAQVTSIEKDENVLKLDEFNPWSEELIDVNIIKGDAVKVVEELPDERFDRVINDPPRFSVAGDLYSLSFFKEIYRILRPGGFFFQYTGSPQEKYRGKSIVKGIGERLERAGFLLRFDKKSAGYVCIKPKILV